MIRYLFLLFLVSACNRAPSGKEVLKKSIEFHDPSNQWHKLQENIRVRSDFIYPDTLLNGIMIGLDNPNKLVSYYSLTYEQHIEFTETSCVVQEGDRSCDQMAWTKNFYHFILGLPMTLRNDEGIVHDSIKQATFNDEPCYRVGVDFEKEKWHFYFSETDYHLVGFAFNKNFESKAEEIKTEGLINVDGMNLPQKRYWWITTDSLAPIYSGSDEIMGSSKWLKNEKSLFE